MIYYMPTMCHAVDSLLYTYPNNQGGGQNGTNKSKMKTLLPFKYCKPYHLRLTLPPLNWFHPSFKSLNQSVKNSVIVRDRSSSKRGTAVFHYQVHRPW